MRRIASCILALLASIPVQAREVIVQQPPPFAGGMPRDCRPPAYPIEALRYELEGETTVELLIDATGEVAGQRIAKSSGWKLLDESVLQTMGACRFTPITHGGKPAGPQWKKFSYVWTLREPGDGNPPSLPVLIPKSCPASPLFVLTDDPLNASEGLMRFLVSSDGTPFGIKIERGSADPAINDAAAAALQQCKFEPAIRDGVPVRGNGFATFKFANTHAVSAPANRAFAGVGRGAHLDKAIAIGEPCKTAEAALLMMKAFQAESAASRNESAIAAEAFRVQMNQKGAALGWDEEKKSAVFRALKATAWYGLLESQINKMRQDMLDLNKAVNVSNLQAFPADTCNQIQGVRMLMRQIDLKSQELRKAKQEYLAAIDR